MESTSLSCCLRFSNAASPIFILAIQANIVGKGGGGGRQVFVFFEKPSNSKPPNKLQALNPTPPNPQYLNPKSLDPKLISKPPSKSPNPQQTASSKPQTQKSPNPESPTPKPLNPKFPTPQTQNPKLTPLTPWDSSAFPLRHPAPALARPRRAVPVALERREGSIGLYRNM